MGTPPSVEDSIVFMALSGQGTDAVYPAETAIHLILDNHSAHVSKETKAWLAASRTDVSSSRSRQSTVRGSISWRVSSKLAHSALRHIRVASKQELKDRIMTAIDLINLNPVVHTWSYMLEKNG
jgi:hypothetical protein